MSEISQRAEAFARERHAGQSRKGAAAEPYVVHVEEVARLTLRWGGGPEEVAAAWLHDTVEDCPPTSIAELEELFGADVAGIVAELTDDKSLPKEERKRLQVVNAPKKSRRACLVKLADKTSNVTALAASPPESWSLARRLDYVTWGETVVAGLRHCPAEGLAEFESVVRRARECLPGLSSRRP